uniref:Uncharacterized protein n=1 Tax=viral metagenome TaxID=1070528 RepID=A0A6C0EBF1_9ZZZZ
MVLTVAVVVILGAFATKYYVEKVVRDELSPKKIKRRQQKIRRDADSYIDPVDDDDEEQHHTHRRRRRSRDTDDE